MSENKNVCACGEGPKLIFSCSGAADLGAIADQAARRLTRHGVGKMFCLAGIGGRVDDIMKKAATASKMLAIDGCELDCAKNTLEKAGFGSYTHLRLTDMGMEKGKTEVNSANIAKVTDRATELLG
jgi:uncharacterized metal-binding protein